MMMVESWFKVVKVVILFLLLCHSRAVAGKIYGNWCGGDHPDIFGDETSKHQVLPHYIDAVDEACIRHDFIYSNYWKDAKPRNDFYNSYPYQYQFIADYELATDVKGVLLTSSSWKCQSNTGIWTKENYFTYGARRFIRNSSCSSSSPSFVTRVAAKAIEAAMYIKILAMYKIGEDNTIDIRLGMNRSNEFNKGDRRVLLSGFLSSNRAKEISLSPSNELFVKTCNIMKSEIDGIQSYDFLKQVGEVTFAYSKSNTDLKDNWRMLKALNSSCSKDSYEVKEAFNKDISVFDLRFLLALIQPKLSHKDNHLVDEKLLDDLYEKRRIELLNKSSR